MVKTLKPPDLQYLQTLRRELEEVYDTQDKAIDEIREVRERRAPVVLGTEHRLTAFEYHDSSVADHIQRSAAMHNVNWPKYQCKPVDESETAEKNATLREHWGNAVLHFCGQNAGHQHTYTRVSDSTFGDGGGWCKFVFRRDLWDERYGLKEKDLGAEKYNEETEKAKKEAGPPFSWVYSDSRNLKPVYEGNCLAEMLEVSERPRSAAFRQYRLSHDASGNIVPEELGQPISQSERDKLTSTVTFMEHWDEIWVTYAVVGENLNQQPTGHIVAQWKHGYKIKSKVRKVPYFFAPGLMHSYWSNRKVGESVAALMLPLCQYRSFLRTIHANLTARDTFATLFREVPDGAAAIVGADGRPVGSETWNIGEIINGRPGERLAPIQFPEVKSLKDELVLTSAEIKDLSVPKVSNDLGSGLEGAGFAMVQARSESRTRFATPGQSLEDMLADVVEMAEHLVKVKVKEPVWVESDGGYISLKPEDLTRPVRRHWDLDVEQPSTKIIENRYWNERLKAGTSHVDQVVEALGDNPDEVRRGKLRDQIRAMPEYFKRALKAMAESQGRGDIVAEVAEAELLQQQGALPGEQPIQDNVTPDTAALAMAPNGAGAALQNGPAMGVGQGPVVSPQAAQAGIQRLG